MAPTGLEIYKLLPKTNCKECGFPTCLAFAMKLAQKGTELDKCPYVSDEAKSALDAASAPPIKLVTIGAGERAFAIGNEVAMFRHEKTFYHQPGLVARVKSDDPALADVAARAGGYEVERVGMTLRLDGLAVEQSGGDAAAYAAAVAAARAAAPGLPLVLMSADAAAIDAALAGGAAADKPLVHAATAANWQAMAEVAKKHGCPLAIRADGDVVGPRRALRAGARRRRGGPRPRPRHVHARRPTWPPSRSCAAWRSRRAPARSASRSSRCPPPRRWQAELVRATQAVAKYAGVVVLDHLEPAELYSLLTLRQNIYTDPQKPIQMEPRLYEIGTPGPDSPVLITTNFSLTYFSVAGEVEGAGVPAWLLVADSDGQSVLTGWAAGKFDAEKIAKTVKDSGIEAKINHKKLVIPGHVAGLSGEVEEELPGLADHGRPARRRRHPQLPQDGLERVRP